MQSVVQKIEAKYKKHQVVDVRSGDTVKVHQKIREGSKERVQVFQGLVIRVDRRNSLLARIVVRKVASGVGVEKSFLLHSPLVVRIEITKRSKVRRNYLTYMRERTGKSARLTGVEFDKAQVNKIDEPPVPAEEGNLDTAAQGETTEEKPAEPQTDKPTGKSAKPEAEEK